MSNSRQIEGTEFTDEFIDLNAVVSVFKRRWVILAGVTTLCISIALYLALTSPPVYRAITVISPARVNEFESSGPSIFPQFSIGGIQSELTLSVSRSVAILRSRIFQSQFVVKHNLDKLLFRDRWDSESERWLPGETGEASAPDVFEIHESFDTLLNISPLENGILTLAVDWSDPVVASEWANLIVEEINSYSRVSDIQEFAANLRYLREEVDKTSSVEMRQILYTMIESQTSNIMLASAREEYAFSVIDPAIPPKVRISPRRTLIMVTGLTVGLVLGLIAMFITNGITIRFRRDS